jgi:flagellar protein FlgJ
MTPSVSFDASQALAPAAPPAGSDKARLGEVARQFEAIFLRQMLSAARSTDFGGDDLFGGQGEETFREMRDARFAEIASDTGAIGLAASIEAQLARFLGPEG